MHSIYSKIDSIVYFSLFQTFFFILYFVGNYCNVRQNAQNYFVLLILSMNYFHVFGIIHIIYCVYYLTIKLRSYFIRLWIIGVEHCSKHTLYLILCSLESIVYLVFKTELLATHYSINEYILSDA